MFRYNSRCFNRPEIFAGVENQVLEQNEAKCNVEPSIPARFLPQEKACIATFGQLTETLLLR
jgi:hypothetical protein